jgi:hypothetical protein
MSGVASAAPRTALRATFLALLVVVALSAAPGRAAAAGNTVESPDSGGQYTSIALDSLGAPVVSHYDPTTADLKIVHCGTPSCASSNSLTSPDTTNNVGKYTSIKLDADGKPVVSYHDETVFDLKVLHCGDANCTSGSGNTIQLPDSAPGGPGNTGLGTSLALDGNGYPVISHFSVPFDGIRLTHCTNSTCSAWAGNWADISLSSFVVLHSSLVLDGSGFPVIAYYDYSNGNLKVAHCGNANCSSGTSVVVADPALGDVGNYPSIALDAMGFPVVSYYDQSGGKLRVLHCGDANCSSGNSITMPDGAGASYTSLELDAQGYPVVSYYSAGGANLRVLQCGDENCSFGNVAVTADSEGDVGQYSSLILDSSGNPVVSYYDATNARLKVLHCSDANCTGTSSTVGGITALPDVARPGETPASPIVIGTLAVLLAAASVAARRLAKDLRRPLH